MRWFPLIVVLGMWACNGNDKGTLLAEVYEARLYSSDLNGLYTGSMSEEDSIFITQEYINSWVARQVVLHEAATVLNDKERDKSRQVEAYRNDLLSYETLNKLAAQRIDSVFDQEELRSYYEANQKEFELALNILKLVYVKYPQDLEDIDELWREFSKEEADLNKLQDRAREVGGNSFIGANHWVYFDDVLKEIPIETYNQEHFLNNNKLITINEGGFRYFVKILDFKTKSDISPFELEEERIKKILFVKRQEELTDRIERELINKAYKNNKIEIH